MKSKITWQYNGGDEVPYRNFWWQGLDGSKILTAIIQGYASEMRPSEIFAKWHQNTEKSEVPIRLHVFGHGDGGGGATPIHLEYMEREKDLEGMPRVISAGPNAFFEALWKKLLFHQFHDILPGTAITAVYEKGTGAQRSF